MRCSGVDMPMYTGCTLSAYSVRTRVKKIQGGPRWHQRLGNFGGWIDAKAKVSWGTEVTQWGPGAKTQ